MVCILRARCVYVCTHVYMYVCMYGCVHVSMHACVYVCVYVYVCAYMFVGSGVYRWHQALGIEKAQERAEPIADSSARSPTGDL